MRGSLVEPDVAILAFLRGGEEGDIDAFEQSAVAVHQKLDVNLEDLLEILVLSRELSKIGDVHFYELDEFLPNKADITLKSQNDCID